MKSISDVLFMIVVCIMILTLMFRYYKIEKDIISIKASIQQTNKQPNLGVNL